MQSMGIVSSYESITTTIENVEYHCYKNDPVRKPNIIWLIVLCIVVLFYIILVTVVVYKICPRKEKVANECELNVDNNVEP